MEEVGKVGGFQGSHLYSLVNLYHKPQKLATMSMVDSGNSPLIQKRNATELYTVDP